MKKVCVQNAAYMACGGEVCCTQNGVYNKILQDLNNLMEIFAVITCLPAIVICTCCFVCAPYYELTLCWQGKSEGLIFFYRKKLHYFFCFCC